MQEKKIDIKSLVTEENIFKFLKGLTFVTVLLYLWFFIYINKCYITYNSDGSINNNTLQSAIVSITCAVLTVVLLFIKNKLSELMNKIISYCAFFLSPVFCYFAFEFFQKSIYGINIWDIRKRYLLLNFIILSVIVLTVFVFTNSIKVSIIAMTIIINLFGVVNYYIYSFRGVALVAADVLSARTAMSVAGGYTLFIDYHICYIFIVTLFIITAVGKLKSFRGLTSLKLRIPAVAVYIVYMALFLNVFIFSDQLKDWNIKVKLFKPHSGYSLYGTFVAFIRSVGLIIVEEPDGYSVKNIENIVEQYSLASNEGERPNIIVIMNESFSDLKSISDFPTNEDYMPFIRSLKENTIKGNVYVSVFGGNTANSEFEFLTGNSMALLPANAISYQLYIRDKFPSIVDNFKYLEYAGNIAMHPYYPEGFNRLTVYPFLGFSQFISLEAFEQSEKLRGKVTDEANFDKIIETYEASKAESDNPFFLFDITMQNHGGYESADPNFITKIKITDEDYYNEEAEVYLSLAKYTDEAVEKLINYFESIEEPTVIVFFGDHQPGLEKSWFNKLFGKSQDKLKAEELMVKYQVPFFAWANYDIEEEEVDGISLNYLSAYIFDKVGINLTRYQQYLLDVHEQVPIMNMLGYWGVNGKFYNYDDKKSPYYDIINQYRCVQYNNMHDKGNRVDSMFYLN